MWVGRPYPPTPPATTAHSMHRRNLQHTVIIGSPAHLLASLRCRPPALSPPPPARVTPCAAAPMQAHSEPPPARITPCAAAAAPMQAKARSEPPSARITTCAAALMQARSEPPPARITALHAAPAAPPPPAHVTTFCLRRRPALSPHLPASLRKLIQSCWHADQSQRPSMNKVREGACIPAMGGSADPCMHDVLMTEARPTQVKEMEAAPHHVIMYLEYTSTVR